MKPVISTAALAIFCVFLAATTTAQGTGVKKIIFDTDIAGDIDDAFAHALVQVSPEVEVLGITVCDGPTDRRAKVSCRMLYLCGQEQIPVAVGRPTRPGSSHTKQLNWGNGFGRVKPIKQPAADFIIETLKKHPGEVTVISVGPVTNLADAIRKDPDAWKLVKEVYAMFGSFYMGYGSDPRISAEWNVRADVESAQVFMTSGVPITLAGLDVTTMVKFGAERRQALSLRNSPLTDALCGLYILWAGGNVDRSPTLFDPVAAAMSFNSDFVSTRKAHVTVDDKGYTVIDESKPPNCEIGMSIRTEAFLDWLEGRLLEQNLMR
ncbi:MAG: nucleoside hydrolase [Candidatus Latescibacteria bacterium]|nr:nucleoside hydrolase [Candidatus Latescibacterota bacterium]